MNRLSAYLVQFRGVGSTDLLAFAGLVLCIAKVEPKVWLDLLAAQPRPCILLAPTAAPWREKSVSYHEHLDAAGWLKDRRRVTSIQG